MALGDKVGSEAVKEAGRVVDDVQADLDKRWNALVALLQGKRIRISTTIEVENKEKINNGTL